MIFLKLAVFWLWLRTSNIAILIYTIALDLIVLVTLIPEARRFMEYSRKGKLKGFAETYCSSPSMARGIKKIFGRRNNLGKWRYLLGFVSTIAFLFIFFPVYAFGKN